MITGVINHVDDKKQEDFIFETVDQLAEHLGLPKNSSIAGILWDAVKAGKTTDEDLYKIRIEAYK